MIKGINSSGRYLYVNGGSPGGTYVNNYGGSQGVGNVRYNTTTQQLEVFDGNNWMQLNMGYATVELTPETEALMEWARKKRDEEQRIEELAKQNATLKDAVDTLKRAQEQVHIIANLVQT